MTKFPKSPMSPQYNKHLKTSNNKPKPTLQNLPQPKISKEQAVKLWSTLTPQQKYQFNEMLDKMRNGKLLLKEVNVDDNEQIQNIVLEPKDKPSQSTAPFAKYFTQNIVSDNENEKDKNKS